MLKVFKFRADSFMSHERKFRVEPGQWSIGLFEAALPDVMPYYAAEARVGR